MTDCINSEYIYRYSGDGFFWIEGNLLNWKSDNSDIDGVDGSSVFELIQ